MFKMPQTKINKKELNIGTFNVRGMTKKEKKANLATDMIRYKIDLCCLQETKIKEGCDSRVKKNRLICLPTENEHYGMGFIISKKMKKFVHKVWRVNDRIAVNTTKTRREEK